MQRSLEELLRGIEEFVVDLDSEYASDMEKMASGRARALRAHLEQLGYTDLVREIDDTQLSEGNVIHVIEVLRGFVIPEVRRRDELAQTQAIEPLWEHIHPRVRAVAKARFDSGHFADAVEAALKELNSTVKAHYRKATGRDADGSDLMHRAFSPRDPAFLLGDLATETGRSTQEGYMFIFAGAFKAVRNPKAHANIQIDRVRAIHHLHLASLLFFVFDERVSPPPTPAG
jgi:uncharacterized protein (TIGR02391 family)